MKLEPILFVLTISIVVAGSAMAEIAPKSKEKLEQSASHIVVGKVAAIYSSTSKGENYLKMNSVAEIAVEKIDKGEGVKPGNVVHARYWSQQWIGKSLPEPGASGHNRPVRGSTVRIYLTKKEGRYDVVLPNGFEETKKSPNEKNGKTNDIADLQGTWDFVYYEEKGRDVEPGTKRFVISNNRLDFRAGGQSRLETTLEVDATRNHFTQNFKDGQVYRSIYRLAGDYLILCGIRDGGRPNYFSIVADGGGEFLIVLKISETRQAARRTQ